MQLADQFVQKLFNSRDNRRFSVLAAVVVVYVFMIVFHTLFLLFLHFFSHHQLSRVGVVSPGNAAVLAKMTSCAWPAILQLCPCSVFAVIVQVLMQIKHLHIVF